MRCLQFSCLFVFVCLVCNHINAQVTQITLTDQVELEQVDRLGFNLGDDNYWAGSAFTKMRSLMNFEGVMYRQLTFGPQAPDGQGYLTWYPPRQRLAGYLPWCAFHHGQWSGQRGGWTDCTS